MANELLAVVLRHLRKLVGGPAAADVSDGQLLWRFVAQREEAAFAALMQRHGPMVLSVCRRVLRHAPSAEDAFQATFLVLARRAGAIRKRESVGSWLHGVAYRLAVRAKVQEARRRRHERQAAEVRASQPGFEAAWHELQAVLDEALQRLPEKYRVPLVLCYLEGQTHEEAARQLGWPPGTVKSRLARARDLLRDELTRRGLALSVGSFATVLAANTASAAVPGGLFEPTLKAAFQFAIGKVTAGVITAQVVAAAEGGLRAMFVTKLLLGALVLALGVAGAGVGLLTHQALTAPPADALAADGPQPAAEGLDQPKPDEEKPARTDRYGDPLPAGALVRLGTVRWRQQEYVAGLAFLPDGRTLVSGGLDNTIRFWDLATGREQRHINTRPYSLRTLALSADGKVLVVGGSSFDVGTKTFTGWVSLRDPDTGKELRKIEEKDWTFDTLVLSADAKTLASVGLHSGAPRLWDTVTGRELPCRQGQGLQAFAVAFSPRGENLAVSSDRGKVSLIDWATDREPRTIRPNYEGGIFSLSSCFLTFSPDGKTLLAEGETSNVCVWDVASGRRLRQFGSRQDPIRAVTFSPDGTILATRSGWDPAKGESIVLRDPATGRQRLTLSHHPGSVNYLAFSPDGNTLASAYDAVIHLWDVATGRQLFATPDAHRGSITNLAFSPDGRTVATGSDDHTVRLWESATGKPMLTLRGHERWVRAMAFSPDGKLLATSGLDSTVRLWDPATGQELRKLPGHGTSGGYRSVVFTPDGTRLASTGDDGVFYLWDVATGKELLKQQLGPSRPRDLLAKPVFEVRMAIAPDGNTLAWTEGHTALHLWDAARRQPLLTLSRLEGVIDTMAFSPDAKILASSSRLNKEGVWEKPLVRLWELATGKELLRFDLPDFEAALAFSPDGRFVAARSGWARGEVHLVDLATGKEILKLPLEQSCGSGLAFAPDGRTLATAGTDTTGLIWNLAPTLEAARFTPPALGTKDLEALWADLAGDDAAKAYQAIWKLVAAGDKAVAFLKDRLRPPELDPKQVRQLLADLDSERFAVREAASKELEKLGELVEPALRQALAAKPSAEVRRRVEALLAAPRVVLSPESLRRIRAIQALERIGSPEGRQVLEALAQGPPAARETRDAKAALDRLARRSAANR